MLTFFVIVSWWVVGASGFVFWWTKDYNLELVDVLLGCFAGIVGPISWVFGYSIHGRSHKFKSKVIIEKRVANEKGVGE